MELEQTTNNKPDKIVEMPINDTPKIVKELSGTILDDNILQSIVSILESPEGTFTLDELEYSLTFIEEKIKYLEDLQNTFGLKNNLSRFGNIEMFLDSLTLERAQHDIMYHFAVDVSALLDLLYNTTDMLIKEYNDNKN